MRRALALALAVALLVIAPAFADPGAATDSSAPESPIADELDPEVVAFREELARRQAEIDELQAQLDALDRDLAIAAEEYNKAALELQATRQRLEAARQDLDAAKAAYEIQQQTLADRARDMYRDGDSAALELIVGSKSLSDLAARARFLAAVGKREADLAEALEAQMAEIASTEAELEEAEAAAASLEFELKARFVEINLRIQERTQVLAAAQSDLLALLDKQAELRRAEEARLLADILAGVSKVGVVVEPGSVVETALGYHGVPYVWGGESPAGFDCSGLVKYVFAQHGVDLPHYSGAQFQLGQKVPPADLRPGDVVFFGSPVYHVGIYVGAGYFVHAPRTGDFVKLTKLAVMPDYAGARRYAWQPRTLPIAGAVADPAAAVPR